MVEQQTDQQMTGSLWKTAEEGQTFAVVGDWVQVVSLLADLSEKTVVAPAVAGHCPVENHPQQGCLS